MTPLRILVTTLLLLLVLPGAQAQGLETEGPNPLRLPDLGDAGSRTLSVPEERRMGERLMREVRMRVPILEDEEVRHYIQDLGERLVAHADSPEMAYEFFVVDSGTINAFAMPGGYIGINRGLIERTRSESELAAVMAHEIAHVSQRHIARRLDDSRGSGLRTLGIVLAGLLLGISDPQMGSAAIMGGMAGQIQEQLNYSRSHEREADNIGMRILADAGLDPQGMPGFFERLAQASRHRQQPPEYLSTHPVTEARIGDSQARASQYHPGEIDESRTWGLIHAKLEVDRADDPVDALRHFEARLDGGTDGEREEEAARYGKALALIRTGEPLAAREDLRALSEGHGEHPMLFLAIARTHHEEGNADEALDALQLGLDLFPGHPPLSLRSIRLLLETGQPEDARAMARDRLRARPSDAALHRLHARAATEAGRTHEGTLALAEHYFHDGKLQRAVQQLERVIGAPDAEIHHRSRAVARRDTVQKELERMRE